MSERFPLYGSRGELGSVGFAQGPDQRVPTLLADFAIEIPVPLIQANVAVFGFLQEY
jgi:hypothetical protein